ncbi:hypothetical protein PVAND_008809 [Polypedilum vanderplanki]|uniref:Coronin n=1 Tax=Polypedilum vanderplanki TaxID=319348 RepID=A0A9J6CBE4_POLVA|nr:hypothetical protein PVAND_008809 [Polypedilum vanderplanki]
MRNDSQLWFRGVRPSKFRHVYGTSKKDCCYTDISIHRNGKDGNICAVNPLFLAIEADAAFIVIPLNHTGRIDFLRCKVIGHSSTVFDLKWNPFNDYEIASASDDCTIKLWNIPAGGLLSCLSEYKAELIGHRRKITQIEWHPSCENVLISCGFDNLVIIWDVSPKPLNGNNILKIIDCHQDQIYSLAINRDGSLIATTSKDKQLRVIEPRTGIVVAQGMCHNGTKCSKVVFLNDDKVLTTGFSKHSDRQYAIWNQHDLKKALVAADIDSASGVIQPFFDYETKTLYLCGKGEGTIRYYEIVDEAPYIYYLNQFISGQPQKSLGWMPKRALDVASCEIFRFYKIHANGNVVEPVSFSVPRKSSLFQADIYPDTLSTKPAMTVYEWFTLGQNVKPILMSMQREPMMMTNKSITNERKANLINSQKNITTNNIVTKVKDEENKIRKQNEIIETRVSKTVTDNNMIRKFAFLQETVTPDYRERIQNKEEKTNTNQSTKIQQLQSIFGGQQQTQQQQHVKEKDIDIIAISDNAEKELRKIIHQQTDEIKNLRNQLKTSDKRIRELEFEVKKLRLERHN